MDYKLIAMLVAGLLLALAVGLFIGRQIAKHLINQRVQVSNEIKAFIKDHGTHMCRLTPEDQLKYIEKHVPSKAARRALVVGWSIG